MKLDEVIKRLKMDKEKNSNETEIQPPERLEKKKECPEPNKGNIPRTRVRETS